MKLLFLPLKLTTEAIWLASRVVRRVLGRKPPGSHTAAPRQAQPEEPKAWAAPKAGGGAGSAAFAAYREQPPAAVDAAAPAALAPGARARLLDGASVKGHTVPAGAVGRIEAVLDGAYRFLYYTDEGSPLLVSDVAGSRLQAV